MLFTAIRTDEKNSYSACVTLLVQESKYYVVDVFRERLDFPELRAKAALLASTYKPDQIVVEDAGVGRALVDELNRLGFGAIPFRPEGNKVARMSVQSLKIEKLLLPKQAPWLDDFEAELFAFPNGRTMIRSMRFLRRWHSQHIRLISGATRRRRISITHSPP